MGATQPIIANGVTQTVPELSAELDLDTVEASIVGTFYRSPSPGAEPFVNEGDVVSPGQQVGIMEAMQLLSPVEADCYGRIIDVLRQDGDSVEFGESLFTLSPVVEA
jgi:acetyl-CoA carboxylase biotin carboxyl carrier protein